MFVTPATYFRGSQNLEYQIPTFQLTSCKCMAPSQKLMKLSDCFCLLLSISCCSRKWLWTNTSTVGIAPISTISLEIGNVLAKSRGSTVRWQWEYLSQQKSHLIWGTFLKPLSLYFLICCRGSPTVFAPRKTIFPQTGVEAMVSGWFKCITFIVHFISIVIASSPPQIIRY